MKINAIIYFNELVMSRSIREAANNLGVSPTAVIRQLENLEYYMGATLFVRGARGIKLTAAGELLAENSQFIIRNLDRAKQGIDDLKGLKRGNVSIHINGAAINTILAPALAEFYQRFPAISIQVTVSSGEEATNAVVNGYTDIAATMFSSSDPLLDIRFTFPVYHEVVVAPNHPLAQLDKIPVSEIRKYPIAMPDKSFGIRRQFDQRQRELELEPIEPKFTTSSLELQKELALNQTAALILPAMSVNRELKMGRLVVRPFEVGSEVRSELQIGRAKNTEPSFAAAKLVDFLEEFLPRYANDA